MNTDIQIPEADEKQILDHAVAATAICQMEDIFVHTVPGDMRDARAIVESVLAIVQDNFYLIPKLVEEDDKLVERPVPKEAITEPLYELWNSVSN